MFLKFHSYKLESTLLSKIPFPSTFSNFSKREVPTRKEFWLLTGFFKNYFHLYDTENSFPQLPLHKNNCLLQVQIILYENSQFENENYNFWVQSPVPSENLCQNYIFLLKDEFNSFPILIECFINWVLETYYILIFLLILKMVPAQYVEGFINIIS